MPELPEVEVTRRGIEPVLKNRVISGIYTSGLKLREPYSPTLPQFEGARISEVSRRAKYILLYSDKGTLLMHLGMTGHLQILKTGTERGKHDHFELQTPEGVCVRLNDIRRFGLVLHYPPGVDVLSCEPLRDLGPEPLSDSFSPETLQLSLQGRKVAIKQALMDAKVVVGVGNIYASESLFAAAVSPLRPACSLSLEECRALCRAIKEILSLSIERGGTTIRDFSGADGHLGYFVNELKVYGHEGEECPRCHSHLRKIVQGQRSTYYCEHCQH
ncbi:MAG: bifunctional DNA-formamidopyrimidine glycosylase/DNA-(apurinic or apyrimidinic site) lyase [Succinivibrio sp.]|nr:bifunctional DNA-formamidopyrimidine glycosylase/DNA-(apurinic or apyrimidinic site) lyase [Succinivibrio sp.]